MKRKTLEAKSLVNNMLKHKNLKKFKKNQFEPP